METAAAETHKNEDLDEHSFFFSFQAPQVPEEPLSSRLYYMKLYGWTAKKKNITNCVTQLEKS